MKTFLVIPLLHLMVGCSGQDKFIEINGQLDEFTLTQVSDVKPLPKMPGEEGYVYQSSSKRDVFERFSQPSQDTFYSKEKVNNPDLSRPKQPLEFFELLSLKMVGSLKSKTDVWALLVDSNGNINKVRKGDFVGKNYGQVIAIKDTQVIILEKISDHRGGWFGQRQVVTLEKLNES